MPDRLVRFRPSFFDDLDRQLPPDRSATGAPSAADFLIYDLPPIRDLLAADFESATTVVAGVDRLRVFLGAGTLVRNIAVYAHVALDGQVDVVGVDLERSAEADDAEHDV